MDLTREEIRSMLRVRESPEDALPLNVTDLLNFCKGYVDVGGLPDGLMAEHGISPAATMKAVVMSESDIREAQRIADEMLIEMGYSPETLLPELRDENWWMNEGGNDGS